MNLIRLVEEIGDDADLLTRSDQWLAEEHKSIAASLDAMTRELRAIQTAQRIKTILQQQNLVAVHSLDRSRDGEISDISVKIMKLPDAITMLQKQNDTMDQVNTAANIAGWRSDGYDVITSAQLR